MMSVLIQMADHYRNLRQQTAPEILLIEESKLVILRYGMNGTKFRKAELQGRLAKIERLLEAFDNQNQSK